MAKKQFPKTRIVYDQIPRRWWVYLAGEMRCLLDRGQEVETERFVIGFIVDRGPKFRTKRFEVHQTVDNGQFDDGVDEVALGETCIAEFASEERALKELREYASAALRDDLDRMRAGWSAMMHWVAAREGIDHAAAARWLSKKMDGWKTDGGPLDNVRLIGEIGRREFDIKKLSRG